MELAGYDLGIFLITLVATASASGVVLALLYVFRARLVPTLAPPPPRHGYTAALRTFAEDLGLVYEYVPSSFDRARGKVGRLDVALGYDSVEPEREGDDSKTVMTITIFATDMADTLVLHRRGMLLEGRSAGERAQTTGNPELDDVLVIAGAPEPLLHVLAAEAELRALLLAAVVERGAVIRRRHLEVSHADFPTTAEAIHARVAPLIELVAWVSEPSAMRTGSALGTASAARLRALDRLETAPAMALLTSYFAGLEATARGTSYPDVGQRQFEWRGERDVAGHTVPVRAVLDWTHSVALAVRRPRREPAAEELTFEFDRDALGGASAPDTSDSTRLTEVGHGVVANCGLGRSRELERRFAALPRTLVERIALRMREDGIRYFRIGARDVTASFWPALDEMGDPDGQIRRTFELLVDVAAAVETAWPADTGSRRRD